MSSSWAPKLEKKLNALADSASKESIQTLSNWIGFNRKHSSVICKTLADSLVNSKTNTARQWLYWQVVHELLLNSHKDSTKWDRLADLRLAIGEHTVVPVLEELGSRVLKDKLEPLLQSWDDHNVFGGPTLIGQIRRLLAASTKTTTKEGSSSAPAKAPMTPSAEPKTTSQAVPTTAVPDQKKGEPQKHKDAAKRGEDTKKQANKPSIVLEDAPVQRRTSLSSLSKIVDYDFASKNVPEGKVESREFLDPCKAIATLQIARDLRNDNAVQLSSLLTNVPKDVLEKIAEDNKSDEDDEKPELDQAAIRDYSIRISSKLLSMDLEEEAQTIQTFQDIVKRQMTAREKLIYLLLKSRCQFGSATTVEEFLALQDTTQKLKRRRQLLGDALELEGMDSEIDNTDFEKPLADLPPLSWYQPAQPAAATVADVGDETTTSPSASKKTKIET